MKFFSKLLASLALYSAAAASSAAAVEKRASLTQVTDFGDNPSNTLMYIYVPNNLATNPAIIVAIHYCGGTASGYYSGTEYAQYAETYGYIVIYPQSPYSGTCWDVASTSALTHNGGGDSNSIANMVTYTISKYNADSSMVFVTGSSSGAMMTNVLAATYPEMFAAGSVYSGVPAGCFMSSSNTVDGWNSSCADGDVVATQAYWTQVVDNMYSGYSGSRPKMMIYHGSVDTILYPPNYNETIKQWTGVFGYSLTPEQTLPNTPQSSYTKYIFGADVVGVYADGVGHTVPVRVTDDLAWFGITGGSTTTTTSSPGSTSTTTGTSTSTAPAGTTVAEWGQCGGTGWTGSTTCASPYTCHVVNSYYSQCY